MTTPMRFGIVAIWERLEWCVLIQLCHSTLVYIFLKNFIFRLTPSTTVPATVFAFVCFQISHLLFSVSLIMTSSRRYVRRTSSRVTLRSILFLVCFGVSAWISVVSVYGSQIFGEIGVKGFAVGLGYGFDHRRWTFDFPLVQRPVIFRYKSGFHMVVRKAFKLARNGYLSTLVVVIAAYCNSQLVIEDLIVEEWGFFIICLGVFFCWELNRHLFEVCLTRRLLFVPPNESLAAVTNPTDYLLTPLEDLRGTEYVRYLAYHDLCTVSESLFEKSRRAPFFEGNGETYVKVMDICLRPLGQLAQPNQLLSLFNESFSEFQVCAWCARIVSSLTVRTIEEDYSGVARDRHLNAATVTTLLAALSAVEALMRRNNITQSAGQKAYSMAIILRTSIYQIVSNFHEEMVTSCKTTGLLEQDWICDNEYGSRELLAEKLRMFIEFQAT